MILTEELDLGILSLKNEGFEDLKDLEDLKDIKDF